LNKAETIKIFLEYLRELRKRREDWFQGWSGRWPSCPVCGPTDVLLEYEEHVKAHLKILRFNPGKVTPSSWIFNQDDARVFKAASTYEYTLIDALNAIFFYNQPVNRRLRTPCLRRWFKAYTLVLRDDLAGYSLWNQDEEADSILRKYGRPLQEKAMVLRQIYLLPEFRGRGLGNILIDAALENLKVKPGDLWLVEPPNQACLSLLNKRADRGNILAVSYW